MPRRVPGKRNNVASGCIKTLAGQSKWAGLRIDERGAVRAGGAAHKGSALTRLTG